MIIYISDEVDEEITIYDNLLNNRCRKYINIHVHVYFRATDSAGTVTASVTLSVNDKPTFAATNYRKMIADSAAVGKLKEHILISVNLASERLVGLPTFIRSTLYQIKSDKLPPRTNLRI